MPSPTPPLQLLANHLELGSADLARFIVSCFNHYVLDFLVCHPTALDPQLSQIQARVRLTLAHRHAGWLWTQQPDDSRDDMRDSEWGQEEHATAFVLRVLDYLLHVAGREGAEADDECREELGTDQLVEELYRRLCIMQSLIQGSGVWVGDARVEMEVRAVLLAAMEEVERCELVEGMVSP
ncbi:hypothetical protein N658DRAFT_433890 [Parathielavia hyrcaniae]|uniref:Uncharacterized protein n=1 Tax=Parathielavia hyrcaniae TaxID=113614 RepID=A0AAN6SYA9_9PEZI|nr:hypothetical protein N658DRAFT_433890 [Parathielavia hyrcaniae]